MENNDIRTADDVRNEKVLRLDITGCARCGQYHPQLEFKRLTRPAERHSHWAACPTNGEPVLLAIFPED